AERGARKGFADHVERKTPSIERGEADAIDRDTRARGDPPRTLDFEAHALLHPSDAAHAAGGLDDPGEHDGKIAARSGARRAPGSFGLDLPPSLPRIIDPQAGPAHAHRRRDALPRDVRRRD